MQTLQTLSERWQAAKTAERQAAEERRQIEDEMRKALKLSESEEGTVKQVIGNTVVKATCRINRKIDAERFLMLANSADINVQPITRWKAELIMSAWKALPEEHKAILAPAITAEPGRPTFSVETTEA
jgi:hypothetical protein